MRTSQRLITLIRRRNVALPLVVSAVLVGGSGAALAASTSGPIDSQGVIHGCWTDAAHDGSHLIVLQDANTKCPRHTTAITWNQTGPAGPAGATGPAGPAGPTGATGPAGPSTAGPGGLDTTIVTTTGQGSAFAHCPADHPIVLGGGASVGSSDSLMASVPDVAGEESADGGWIAIDVQGTPITTYAICAK